MKNERGFALIEWIIVALIILILVLIAFKHSPSPLRRPPKTQKAASN